MLRQRSVYTSYAVDIFTIMEQARQEGKEVSGFISQAKIIADMHPDNPEREVMAARLLDDLSLLPLIDGYPYIEPSDLEGIKEQRPAVSGNLKLPVTEFSEPELYNKIYGAWLGRCVGCLLGQPIEGWVRERIYGLLRDTGNYPMQYYISSDIPEEIRKKYGVVDKISDAINVTQNWINNVKTAPEDDDTNYTILGLKILETYGTDFTSDDVAESWLLNLPILHTFTAETAAYRNLVNRVWPPLSGSYRNPFCEYIGAQIRADIFGYINPGNIDMAAEMAWRDASISHTKNGIYGEIFVASMLSAAAVISNIEDIIKFGLSRIPEKCRLAEKINMILDWKKQGLGWEECVGRIHQDYDEKISINLTHTITNAMLVCIGLLYGGLDFGKSVTIAVQGAFDTDCNGATVGSIVGMILGAEAIPQKWTAPLNDTIKSGVDGFGVVKISELAKRTVNIIKLSNKIK